MTDYFVCHADGIVEHIKACFAWFAAATEGNNHNICIVKFVVFTGAYNGVMPA